MTRWGKDKINYPAVYMVKELRMWISETRTLELLNNTAPAKKVWSLGATPSVCVYVCVSGWRVATEKSINFGLIAWMNNLEPILFFLSNVISLFAKKIGINL